MLSVFATPSLAQTTPTTVSEKAPVVVDGRVLFQVGEFGRFSADERARIINDALEQEVRSGQEVDLQVAREDDWTVIRSESSDRHLLTVGEEDTISGTSSFRQAVVWRRELEAALRRSQLERTPAYFRQALGFAIGVLLGAIAIHVALGFLGRMVARQLRHWLGEPALLHDSREQSAKLFVQLAILGLQLGLGAAVAFYITDLFPQARRWRYQFFNVLQQLFAFLNSRVITLGDSRYSALELLLLLALTIGLWFAVSSLTRLFKSYVLAKTGADLRVQDAVAVLMQYVLTFLGLIVLLQIWGLDVGSLTILASVFGVGIGFGVQNIANNFISGLIITLERPIQVGDFVNVGDLMGTVEQIGARSTEICTLDQVTIIVPNSRFLESEVINWSHGDPVSRQRLPVGVAYGSDIEKVQMALLEAARSHPDVLLRPRPQVWFQGFGDSALNFDLLVWTGEPKKQFKVRSDLYYQIEASLRRYGIEVPFPQRDLHLRSPQLDEALNVWLRQHSPTPPQNQLYYPDGAHPTPKPSDRQPPAKPSPQPPETILSASQFPNESALPTVVSPEKLTATNIERAIAAMRGADGLEIKDRRYRLNIYPACFVGSEAVNWLMRSQNCTREEAIDLGQTLVERGIIHHVTDDHPFRDTYLFYRFYEDERE